MSCNVMLMRGRCVRISRDHLRMNLLLLHVNGKFTMGKSTSSPLSLSRFLKLHSLSISMCRVRHEGFGYGVERHFQ